MGRFFLFPWLSTSFILSLPSAGTSLHFSSLKEMISCSVPSQKLVSQAVIFSNFDLRSLRSFSHKMRTVLQISHMLIAHIASTNFHFQVVSTDCFNIWWKVAGCDRGARFTSYINYSNPQNEEISQEGCFNYVKALYP